MSAVEKAFAYPYSQEPEISPAFSVNGPLEERTVERAEFTSLAERNDAVREIVSNYGDHPRVNQLLGSYLTPLNEVEQHETFPDAVIEPVDRFRLLKDHEVLSLFKKIELGLLSRQRLLNCSPVSYEATDIAALAELAASYRVVFSCNLRLVKKFALDFSKKVNDMMRIDEIEQEGYLGLSDAIGRYDYRKGYAFSTYAYTWIDQSMRRGYNNLCRPVRLPHHIVDVWSGVKKTREHLTSELGREPSIKDVAEAADVDEETVNILIDFGPTHLKSLEEPVENGTDSLLLGDTVSNIPISEAEEDPHKEQVLAELEELFSDSGISNKRKFIFCLRYGVLLPSFKGKRFTLKGEQYSYEEFFTQWNSDGQEMSSHEVAQALKMEVESVETAINKSRKRIESLEKFIFEYIRIKPVDS